jgi:hypothetical protein
MEARVGRGGWEEGYICKEGENPDILFLFLLVLRFAYLSPLRRNELHPSLRYCWPGESGLKRLWEWGGEMNVAFCCCGYLSQLGLRWNVGLWAPTPIDPTNQKKHSRSRQDLNRRLPLILWPMALPLCNATHTHEFCYILMVPVTFRHLWLRHSSHPKRSVWLP